MDKNYSNKFNPFLPGIYPYLETRFSSYAFKCLKMLSLSPARFVSPNTKIITERMANFKCLKANHSSINFDCSCGFYSFKTLEDAWDYSLFAPETLIFKVRLLGTVIEHNIGYRSESQEITHLLHSPCYYKKCSLTSEYLLCRDSITLSCLKHAKGKALPLSSIDTSELKLLEYR